MIVCLAGMPRSGSTFSFNVVREVLRTRGTIYQEPCDDVLGAVHRSEGVQHILVKTQGLDDPSMELAKAGAFQVIITVRRVEDAIASWTSIFGEVTEDALIEIMRRWLRMFCELRNQAVIVTYEQIDNHPWLAAWRIARSVCRNVGPMEIFRIARQLDKAAVKRQVDRMQPDDEGVHDMGWSYYDAQTFFHRRHVSEIVSRPAEERLPQERLAHIRNLLVHDICAAGLLVT